MEKVIGASVKTRSRLVAVGEQGFSASALEPRVAGRTQCLDVARLTRCVNVECQKHPRWSACRLRQFFERRQVKTPVLAWFARAV
jgi:hypothetical protein